MHYRSIVMVSTVSRPGILGRETCPGHSVENSRSSDNETDTRPSRHIPVYASSIATSLLVAEGNKSNSQVDGFFGDLHDGDANDSEDNSDAQIAQRPGDQLSSSRGSHDEV